MEAAHQVRVGGEEVGPLLDPEDRGDGGSAYGGEGHSSGEDEWLQAPGIRSPAAAELLEAEQDAAPAGAAERGVRL